MNTTNAFRSNLMQQLASAALKSQRPPLALMGWIQSALDDNEEMQQSLSAREKVLPKETSSRHHSILSSIGSSSSLASLSPASGMRKQQGLITQTTNSNSLMSTSSNSNGSLVSYQNRNTTEQDQASAEKEKLARDFQTLLQTRRTGTSLVPRDISPRDRSFWNSALERAVLCAIQAPNHKRTEPVTFKRMIAPSERTQKLAEIAYETHLRRKLRALPIGATEAEKDAIQASVSKKRTKWDQIPAFLVALVQSTSPIVRTKDESTWSTTTNPYEPLAFVPPTTERDLEDYATACSGVQNCLLSLHAEQIATKWVTGPVIQTPAFRELVQAKECDRVVALIMVGEADNSTTPHRRRRMRREFHGDVLMDL